MIDIVKLALETATEAHKGQFRNDGKTPYITHPEAVASKFSDPVLIAIALLHDVLEDSDMTLSDLEKQGFPMDVIFSVGALTKVSGESYLDYILSIRDDPRAKAVKIEDLKHNLSTLEPKNKTMRDKYQLALYILEYDR